MKRLGIFWALCVFLIILAGCNNGTTGNNQGDPIVCLGDSLTAGYGATTPGVDDKSKSYPAYLQKKVNIPVINAGVSGDTSAQGLARVDTEVLSHNPEIVIILLGANDIGRGIPVATARDNLQSIINKINDGSRKIYFAKCFSEEMLGVLDSMPGLAANYAAIARQYNDMFNTLASRNNLTLVEDIWDGVWGIHMSDGIHPDAAGYEIMADNIFKVLRPYLQANNLVK